MFLLRNSPRIGSANHRQLRRNTLPHLAVGDPEVRRHNSSNNNTSGIVHGMRGVPGVPPAKAKVVIGGGGVMGAAVAYYLGLSGWGEETVLIEQEQ